MINITDIILWYVQLPQVFSHIGQYTDHIIYTEHIMHDLMNITPVYPMIKITPQVPCDFNGIHKSLVNVYLS